MNPPTKGELSPFDQRLLNSPTVCEDAYADADQDGNLFLRTIGVLRELASLVSDRVGRKVEFVCLEPSGAIFQTTEYRSIPVHHPDEDLPSREVFYDLNTVGARSCETYYGVLNLTSEDFDGGGRCLEFFVRRGLTRSEEDIGAEGYAA